MKLQPGGVWILEIGDFGAKSPAVIRRNFRGEKYFRIEKFASSCSGVAGSISGVRLIFAKLFVTLQPGGIWILRPDIEEFGGAISHSRREKYGASEGFDD